MIEIEKYFCKVYDNLETGDYHIESLEQSAPDIEMKSNAYINYLKNNVSNLYKDVDETALYKFIIIQLDYYTFSNTGSVFIADSDYDYAVSTLNMMEGKYQAPTTNHFQPSKVSWQLKKHNAPQMVGSVSKSFSIPEVEHFISTECNGLYGTTNIVFAPKYDGVGICLEYDPSKYDIVSALTRKDGTYGQELIKLIQKTKNYDDVVNKAITIFGSNRGFIKGEILLSQTDFNELIKEKPYKNRRNGTSGLINTPSNIEYAKYLTVMPLVYGIQQTKNFKYIYSPDGYASINYNEIKNNLDIVGNTISDILYNTHQSSFEYRTDGVVIFVDNIHITYNNVMEHAIAYKTNSKTNITKIVNGYISIGRSGKATPMIKVEPCDLNETMVTDVSLSNFNKVLKLDLHEHDTIAIESSGDVIPMVSHVVKIGSAMPLYFDLKCPICGYNLVPYTAGTGVTEYECRNNNCPRIISGKITNFLEKLGANGISDQTVLNIYEALNLRDITDFLDTKKYRAKLTTLPDWGATSANNFCNEIERIKSKPITYGEFLGALGIPGISTKKCKSLFSVVDYNNFMKLCHAGNFEDADRDFYTIKGFSVKSIDTFMDFIKTNLSIIDKLSESFTLVNDKRSDANVVFTGFRDKEMEEYLSRKGIEVSDNINGQTIAVVSANKSSGKTKKAIERNIPVFDAYSAPMVEICDYIISNLR